MRLWALLVETDGTVNKFTRFSSGACIFSKTIADIEYSN